jgi:hypothetical protein
MSEKISETGGKNQKQDIQTFKNDRIFGTPKIAEKLQVRVGRNMYEFWSISENIELIGMPKILDGINFETVSICLWRCRKFCIKMRVVPESQTVLVVPRTVETPQYF